jgi:hypothetical protein
MFAVGLHCAARKNVKKHVRFPRLLHVAGISLSIPVIAKINNAFALQEVVDFSGHCGERKVLDDLCMMIAELEL